jgi:hypothetical protein
MAYYIFLKSLRSLEEFRKNPHVKIPPKSPSTNFQSRAIIKNQFFIQKINFFHFRPRTAQQPVGSSGLSARPLSPVPPPPAGRARTLGPSRPARPWRNCQKLSLLRVCAARRLRLSLCHHHAGPTCQLHHLPRGADPGQNFPAPPLSLRCCLTPWMPPNFYNSASSLPPLTPFKPSVNGP